MKLIEILQEDWGNWAHSSDLRRTASGGFMQASGFWRYGQNLWNNSKQHKAELDILDLIKSRGDKGWIPEKLSYVSRNRIKQLEMSGLIAYNDSAYFITDLGIKWKERLDKQINPFFTAQIPIVKGL